MRRAAGCCAAARRVVQAVRLDEFNNAERMHAVAALRPCADVTRWCEQVADHRPYATVDALLAQARRAAEPFTSAEIEVALAHHPRIGERPSTDSTEASMSRSEQSGVDPSDGEVQDALVRGNRAYEARFGRVFLIRAAGRDAREILASLSERLEHSPEQEERIVAEQLREIALLRLKGMMEA